jgi:hypothetical protein
VNVRFTFDRLDGSAKVKRRLLGVLTVLCTKVHDSSLFLAACGVQGANIDSNDACTVFWVDSFTLL